MRMLYVVRIEGLAIVCHIDTSPIPLTLGSQIGRSNPADLSVVNNRNGKHKKDAQIAAIVEVIPTQYISSPLRCHSLHDRSFRIDIAQLQLSGTQIAVVEGPAPTI